jgi:hypothetical protein
MRPLASLRAVQLFRRRRRSSSLPVEIPTTETRRRRQPIGLAPATRLDCERPSGRRVDHSAQDDRESRAVLTVFDNDAFPLPVR